MISNPVLTKQLETDKHSVVNIPDGFNRKVQSINRIYDG